MECALFQTKATNFAPMHLTSSDTAVRGGGIVKDFAASCILLFVFCLGPTISLAQSQPSPPNLPPGPAAPVTLAPGARIELDMMRPVWAATARAGDPVYAQVSFPAVADDRLAIPAGAYVLGTIEKLTRPTRRTSRAEIDILFTKIIFANGYTVELPGDSGQAAGAAPTKTVPGESLMAIKLQATTANDVLLDNGTQVEMTLEAPLALNAGQIAQSIPLERAPQPQQFKSASMCRYIAGTPGTPGTPDTVIPGSPGTPSTTVPGGPGMPDITIPGTPATPPTVIPGTPGMPGTPGRTCPSPPLVISSTPMVPNASSSISQPVAAN